MAIELNPNLNFVLKELNGGGFDSRFPNGGDGPAPSPLFTPMIAEDFSAGTLGQNYSGAGTWKAASCLIDAEHAFSGGKAMKIARDMGQAPGICGGDTYYGGRQPLPVNVPLGKTIWFRPRFYFPSTFSWGYVYSGDGSDDADAATCGKTGNTDGNIQTKMMRLSPDVGTGRLYLMPSAARRQISQPATPHVITLASEAGGASHEVTNPAGKWSLDAWIAPQMAVKVANDGTGWIRYWLGDQFIDEVTNINTVDVSATGVNEWAIGTYWNGVPFTDGLAGRDAFWMDDVIIASDADGYGAPTTTDSGGRLYIPSSVQVGDFA